jgi:hypothetical protein
MYAERRCTTLDVVIAPPTSLPVTSQALTSSKERSIDIHPYRRPDFEVITASFIHMQIQRQNDMLAVVPEEVQPALYVDVPPPPAIARLEPVGPDSDPDPAPDGFLRCSQEMLWIWMLLGMRMGQSLGGAGWRTLQVCRCEHAVQEHAAPGLSRLVVVDLSMTMALRIGQAHALVVLEPRPTRSLLPWSGRPVLRLTEPPDVPQRLDWEECR